MLRGIAYQRHRLRAHFRLEGIATHTLDQSTDWQERHTIGQRAGLGATHAIESVE